MATASQVMNYFKRRLMDQNPALDLDSSVIKVMLLMVGTNFGSSISRDFSTFASATLSEFDGAGYDGGSHSGADRKEFASDAIAIDEATDFAWWDVADVVWTGLSVGAANIEGALVYVEVGVTDTSHKPLFYIKFPSSIAATGGDITMQINASGILKLT